MNALANGASLPFSAPELVLVTGLFAALLYGLFAGPRASGRAAAAITIVTCAGAAIATLFSAPPVPTGLWGGLLARDGLADFFKLLVLGTTAAVAWLCAHVRHPDPRDAAPELHVLLLAAALGCLLMASAADLLLVYLAVELTSLTSYVLTGFSPRSRRSSEAALKYVIYGGVASAAMLYGMSLLYGLAASTNLAAIRDALSHAPLALSALAITLCLAGLGYKVAVVPFHMWCPDVYEGAPTPVTAFLSVAPKAAGFALLLRFCAQAAPVTTSFTVMLLMVGVASMTVGNLAALGQRNVKRLLAYSSIAHAGYLVLGVATGPAGARAVLLYSVAYAALSLAAFTVVVVVSDPDGDERVDAFRGLGFRAPVPALAMTIALFGLTGLPPTSGFVAKFSLFAALIDHGHADNQPLYIAAALIAVFNSVLSLGYYARLLRLMYLERGDHHAPALPVRPAVIALLVALTAPTLILGVYWGPLGEACTRALLLWTA